jgi:hypothetical protein
MADSFIMLSVAMLLTLTVFRKPAREALDPMDAGGTTFAPGLQPLPDICVDGSDPDRPVLSQ